MLKKKNLQKYRKTPKKVLTFIKCIFSSKIYHVKVQLSINNSEQRYKHTSYCKQSYDIWFLYWTLIKNMETIRFQQFWNKTYHASDHVWCAELIKIHCILISLNTKFVLYKCSQQKNVSKTCISIITMNIFDIT